MTQLSIRRYQPAEGIIARRLGDEMVVVHLGTNRIYELNPTAARLWELAADGITEAEATERLVHEFGAERLVVAEEVQRTLSVFSDEGLLDSHVD